MTKVFQRLAKIESDVTELLRRSGGVQKLSKSNQIHSLPLSTLEDLQSIELWLAEKPNYDNLVIAPIIITIYFTILKRFFG